MVAVSPQSNSVLLKNRKGGTMLMITVDVIDIIVFAIAIFSAGFKAGEIISNLKKDRHSCN